MHFKYYDVFSYVDATGANPSQEVVTTLSFQPYPVSDAIGWCGSVLASHPAALEVMAGQLTFDFAFDVYNGPNHIFMGTQVVPRFEMRSYGTLTINVWAGSDLQTFSSNAVVNNTNPNNQDRWDVDPNYYSRVSFHGGGVLPDGVWVSADSFNPDGSRKLNPDSTWNVTVVPVGTPGATWHDNAFAGYAFILRADGLRMLDWFNEPVYGPDPCTNKNCDDNNPCTVDSCVGGVCVHTIKNCDDNNDCTIDTCNTSTGTCVHTKRGGSCDDGNACTLQDICVNGQCVGTAIPGCGTGGVDTSKNNFTMVAPDGTLSGGTNDVRFTWDGTKKTSVATSGQIYNATISSPCPFNGFTWKAHDVAIYGPGTYTVNPCCPAGSPGCALTCLASDGITPISPITFTVGAGEIGGHMLFNWSINPNIDVVNVWMPNQVFAPSPLFDGTKTGGCGTNPPTKVWDWMSKDWGSCGNWYVDPDTGADACSAVADGVTDSMNGAPMIDGPFNGQNVNFNLMERVVDLCAGVICNDNNACTTDTCDPAIGCVYTPIPSCDPCFDAATRCNDSNICTTDTCDPVSGACINTNNTLSCDDGNACTTGDVCSNGNCAGTPVSGCGGGGVDTIYNNFTMIDALGALAGGANDVHFTWDGTKKTSVAVSGQVSNATLSSPCPFSGIQWTAHDVAVYGPGTYTVNPCCPAGSPSCSDTCNDPNTGYPILPITFIVGEGELGAHMLFNWGVTKNIDVVDIWSPKVAFGPSPLLTGACGSNPANKVWDWMSKDWNGDGFNGSPMVDGPFQGFSANFNVMGVPSPSACVPPAGNCDDNNPCTADSVDTNSNPGGICACINTPVADGTPCNDGNACTVSDYCQNGVCTGVPTVCAPADQCHLPGVCNTTTGICSNPPAPGLCCGVVCTGLDQCHVAGVCNTATGACSNPIKTNGTACNDNNTCTINDVCINGICGGTLCPPQDACSLPGSCDTATGMCRYPPPIVCTALDQCHVAGICNSSTGVCSNPTAPNGTACNDGNACTMNDVCSSGVCTGAMVNNAPGIITTVAGNGIPTLVPGMPVFSGDGGPAISASLSGPVNVAIDSSGNIYIADDWNNRIRKVDTNGTITTIAGNGTSGYSGDGGPATSASISTPQDAVLDSSGNIYVSGGNRIRKIDTNGTITTIAGNGTWGYSGDGGPATSASLNDPQSMAVDSSGNIYIADVSNHRIRKINTNGIITTIAGNGIQGYSGDGGPAISASLNDPDGVAVDLSGNIYIAVWGSHRIRKVDTGGIITTVAGNGTPAFSGDGGPATSASLNYPYGVAVDSSGNIYIGDAMNSRVRKVDSSGIITTIAGNGTWGYSGDGGPAASASLKDPYGIAVDSSGNIYIADFIDNRIRKVSGPIVSCLCQPDGTPCNDGNACTVGDSCQNGVCMPGGPVVCPALDQCHLPGVCNTATGICSNPPAPGLCCGVVCTALDQCHVAGTCNTATGACSNPIAPNGTFCNDNNACTTGDVCTNGTCAGTPIICPPPDQCHDGGVCDPATGLCPVYSKPNGTSCSDGNACTTGDVCTNGICVGTAVVCVPPATCNTATGQCQGIGCTASNVGAFCNDNNACTTNDTCVAKTVGKKTTYSCQGTALSCDDSNACTNDSCNPATGCVHTPVVCDDNNICTIDSCDPAVGCVYKPKCDDGNICTKDICNPTTGACTYVPRPKSVTMVGSKSDSETDTQNLEIQATFTVTNEGCIMYASSDSMVKVSPGSLITITCAGTGPAPNYATLDGQVITIPDNYTCPDLDVNHKIHVTNMGKQGKGPGHDIDDYQLKASTNADSW